MADTSEILGKQDLLAAIERERAELDAVFAAIEDSRMLAVIREDGWTAKDVLAHITTWEARLMRWIDRWHATGTPERPEPGIDWGTSDNKGVDLLNKRDFEAAQALSVEDARRQSADAYERVIAEVERLSERELVEPTEAWDGLALSWVVRANTDEHYREHREEMQRWLAAHPN